MILPGTGRGTIRRMVEGGRLKRRARWRAPSVSAPRCHLPVPGRILLLAFALVGCAQATVPKADTAHPTIVSLNPCSDAILAEVAEPAQLLAISHYSLDPRATSMPLPVARRYRMTGGTVEEVLALDPDVVVADPFIAPATRGAFERLGIRVEVIGIAASVAESEAQVRQLAALAGHPGRGEALVARIEAALSATRRTGGIPALLWQQGGLVPGEGTLAAELLAHTGFASHSAARGLGQGAYLPLEEVLADPPRVILAAGSERAQAHPALEALADVRHAKLDPALLYCGGPTIPRLARRLAQVRDRVTPPPPTPSSEEEGALPPRLLLPLLFRGGGRGVVEAGT
jgi:iron complex transport system substrate-binding protein